MRPVALRCARGPWADGRGKSVRWHVNQLTEQDLVIGSWIFPGGDECKLVQMCSYLPMPIAGFGSSDCATCRKMRRDV